MSTLELIFDAHKSYKLWSWTNGSVHYVAHYIRRLHPNNTPSGRENIWTVRIGERGSERAPRSNRDEDADVGVVKLAFTREAAKALEREAHCYAQLQDVQGIAVPRCLGHFHSKTKGVEMSCLVLDYCVGAPGEQMYEPHRKIMAAAYALHERNVMHGDLLDGRHFVKSGRRMLIVDFAAAVPHQCPHNREIRGPDGRRCIGVCPELSALARIYGVYNP
ncbi:hypothetical protein C8F04DRAFT_1046440 [Mycena alexandri]|uniref:Protein kinase domain-containing protein n=1 Tax=Mycena alexandri TaxID=1745969 RepID=A0AAD6SCY8_9AGAR|nr:hypothetical protein C8F04DRAFT_1046440 [Mycena alexandri]